MVGTYSSARWTCTKPQETIVGWAIVGYKNIGGYKFHKVINII
jgi:hypothetical protein